ncbi:MAG TPA: aldo/keto reductase [Bryobacteraceae bacterium]|nr:aldo/keto reductase [Bryobacteraceae bacterium]
MSYSRREAMRFTTGAAMATTFLPVSGKFAAWAHPAESKLATRPLGRTGREVTTFGLAGGNKVMWDLPGNEGVEIVVKAVRMGLTYLETANNYQLSQQNYGKAFRILNLVPGETGYDASLRARLFIASKTGLRTALVRGNAQPVGRSAGGGKTCLDDLFRSLTQFFGDGKGYIPEGAYLDLMQIHSLTSEADVDTAFEGIGNPSDPGLQRVGCLAALVDYRDGSNLTGLNPKHKKYIRHIGITGHENPTAHMHAMRRDKQNHLETLLVAMNPNDRHNFCHQTNSIPVAAGKNMGIIGMKIFADGAMYGLAKKYASQPGQSVLSVGQPGKVPHTDFLRYALSIPGVSTLITGIGLTDKSNDPARDQLAANLLACQNTERLSSGACGAIEQRVSELHGTDTNFFQRPSSGLLPPQTVTVKRKPGDTAATVEWSTAFAAGDPIARYEIYRRTERIASVPYQPQTSEAPFSFSDTAAPQGDPGGVYYRIKTIDSKGRSVDSISARIV